jgi:Transcription factor zinc-finger
MPSMNYGARVGSAGRQTDLIVRECHQCGRPTVFAQEPAENAVCAGCAGEPAPPRDAARSCPIDDTPLAAEHRSGVTLDRCPSCDGVWLDSGELELVVQPARRVAEGRGDRVADLLVDILAGQSGTTGRGRSTEG